jgi:DNA-binding PadR family transcriptional regulator
MDAFIQRHEQDVIGVLNGFDRMRFRGTLRWLCYAEGLDRYLVTRGVPYKNFGVFAQSLSERVKDHAREVARKTGRPFEYLTRSNQEKEKVALAIAARDGVTEGLVCVLSCVEPCQSFAIRRDGHGGFAFRPEPRKCMHLYFYYLDREFGLMHVRLATWLPFGLDVCLNGREYLARRMNQAGIGYEQRDNCFTRIDDLPRAQRMLQDLEGRKWERFLNTLARRVNPLVGARGKLQVRSYYWSLSESEYATDVMFRDAPALAGVYPALVDHAIKRFDSQDVLRFLGQRTTRRFNGEVSSSLLTRSEGIRVKHRLQENSIKMYDKQGSVLRIETTINNARRFKVRKMTVWQGVRRMRWIPMRHGVADLARRVEISRAANERYLEALAVVKVPCPAHELLDAVSRPVTKDERPYRALRPVSPAEAAVFEAVLQGQFHLKGFTNRDLRNRLAPRAASEPQERRRTSGRITRLLRLLRAHGLIRKVSGTRYYRVTPRDQRIMSAALTLRAADVTQLAA